jgi:hypothetical protein
LGTLGLLLVVSTMAVMIVAIPQMLEAVKSPGAPGAPAMPAGAQGIFIGFMLLTMLVFYIGIPAIFVWFYRAADVRQTLEYYDPTPRWTDKCPLPVLGISVACALAAGSCLLSLINYKAMPVFGFILTGAAGMGVILVPLAVFAFAAVLIYRQRIAGWWLVVTLIGVFTLSTIVTAARLDTDRFVKALEMTPEAERMYRSSPMSGPMMMGIVGAIVSLVMLGYLLWARKFFQQDSPASVTTST